MRLIFLLSFISFFAYADPFYTDPPEQDIYQQAVENEQQSTKNVPKRPACHLPAQLNPLNIGVAFNQLNLIGILKRDTEYRALFKDEQQRIIDLKIDDLLQPEYFQITRINFKGVHYIDWLNTQNCTTPKTISMKF